MFLLSHLFSSLNSVCFLKKAVIITWWYYAEIEGVGSKFAQIWLQTPHSTIYHLRELEPVV